MNFLKLRVGNKDSLQELRDHPFDISLVDSGVLDNTVLELLRCIILLGLKMLLCQSFHDLVDELIGVGGEILAKFQ